MLLFVLAAGASAEIRVDNPKGDVVVNVVYTGEMRMRTSSPDRMVTLEDVRIEKKDDDVSIRVRPADEAQINLEIDLPFGPPLEVTVRDGAFRYRGFPGNIVAAVDDGPVEIEAPWDLTHILVLASDKPKRVELPGGFGFKQGKDSLAPGVNWTLKDKIDEDLTTYGYIQIRAGKPSLLQLDHMPMPAEAPVRMHWQARDVAERILSERSRPRPRPQPAAELPTASLESESEALFTSDVRLVNLTAAVFDEEGRSLSGLTRDDFAVLEDGQEQRISAATSEEEPFNLAILFDFSGSTVGAREQMKEIAKTFTRVARPQDKLAFYVLARNQVHVVAPLTTDHDRVRKEIDEIPKLDGGSPVYDAIVLAYDQELAKLEEGRNALLIISDGKDNRIELVGAPSKVSFRKLVDVAKRMNSLLYPVFLGPNPEYMRKKSNNYEAYARFVDIARAAGGRAFAAATVEDFEKVTKEVAEDLRSVYSIAYYPKNQDFDGAWRNVEIKVDRPGARVRHRDGYFAQ